MTTFKQLTKNKYRMDHLFFWGFFCLFVFQVVLMGIYTFQKIWFMWIDSIFIASNAKIPKIKTLFIGHFCLHEYFVGWIFYHIPFYSFKVSKGFFVKEKSKQHWFIEMYSAMAPIISCASDNFAQYFHLLVK